MVCKAGEHLRAKYTDHAGNLSANVQVAEKDVKRIKAHAPDTPLADFDLTAIETLIDYWRKRPATRNKSRVGKPMAVKTCKNTIKRIRHFIRWLHKEKGFDWRKPADYEVLPVRFVLTGEKRAKKVSPDQVQTYTVDQLVTLFRHARPGERLLMLLSLNCAFGIAELAQLRRDQIHLGAKHRKYATTGNYIFRLRDKTEVYGEWQLWDITIQGIRWYLETRPPADTPVLLAGKNGRALAEQTHGGNRALVIPNALASLTERIPRLEVPAFPKLSYNKLRKTSQDAIRQIAGGEIAGIFGGRGKTVASDDQIEVYTNRPFQMVFMAIKTWGEQLRPMFDAVAEPFAEAERKHRKTERFTDQSKRVIELREQGKTYKAISQETGISVRMVRYYLDKHKANQPADNA